MKKKPDYMKFVFEWTHPLHYRDIVVDNYEISVQDWIGRICNEWYSIIPNPKLINYYCTEVKIYTRLTDEELLLHPLVRGFDGEIIK